MRPIKSVYLFFFILCLTSACHRGAEKKAPLSDSTQDSVQKIAQAVSRKSRLSFDHTLAQPEKHNPSYLVFTNKGIEDTLDVWCKCEKNVRQNRIAIQLFHRTHALSEMKKGEKPNGFLVFDFSGAQESYLTFYLKDSIMERAELFRRSQEKQFLGKYFMSAPIDYYDMTITKSRYNVVQNIWGQFELELPLDFNNYPGERIIKGHFICENMEIQKFDTNPKLPAVGKVTINKNLKFPQQPNKHTPYYNGRWKCSKDPAGESIIIENDWEGLAGAHLRISISKNLHAGFSFNTWTDQAYLSDDELHQAYTFSRYELVLNRNPFQEGLDSLVGSYWIATEPLPRYYGERLIQKSYFICPE